MFYTYYKQWGNTIFFSYVDDVGLTHHNKINDYKPKLYLESDEPNCEWLSLYGKPLKSIEFDTIKEAKSYREQYKDVEGFKIHGNMKFDSQFVIELFEGEMPQFDGLLINGCILDIEVTAPEFPSPLEAKYEIDLVTVYSIIHKKYFTFSRYDYDQSIDESDAGKVDLEFVKYDTEFDLLSGLIRHIREGNYHFCSGWNSSGFDMPYLVQRIEKILGKNILKTLSPYGIVNKREAVDDFMNDVLKVDIIGLPEIDYMLMYKKHILKPRENYKLDYICRVELDKTKLDHSEEGSLFNLANTNPQKYVSYNITDVLRIVELDERLNLISLTYAVAYYCMANFTDSILTIPLWEILIAKELYKTGKVPLSQQNKTSFRPFTGGFVKDPLIGLHKWMVSTDLNSLYPHVEMQINISPETYIPYNELPEELQRLQDSLKVKDPDKYWIQCQNLVNKEVDLSVLKKYDVSMSASGVFYKRDIIGIIPQIKKDLYSNRKKVKKEMLKEQQRMTDIEESAKHRGIIL